MYPVPGLLNDVKHHWFLLTVEDDIIDFLSDGVDVVAGDACYWLQLVLEGSGRVLFGVLEEEADLVFELIASVGFAEDGKLEWSGLFEDSELIEIDVGEGGELVLLVA